MKFKSIVSTLFFLISLAQGFSQNINFTLANPQPIINEVYSGTILSGDLDNDGDMDLLHSGIGTDINGLAARASIFLNDGTGNFTLQNQNFNNFSSTEGLLMSDLDNDQDLDIIITASNRTDFYRNNGLAQFAFVPNTPFLPSFLGDLIAGDVDGDGDNDVIQFGKSGSGSAAPYFALLFFNDGTGMFTQSQNTPFLPFKNLKLEFIDLEGDGDLDVLSFGEDINYSAQVAIFENDGTGNYSVLSNSNIAPHIADEISVGDIDNDGDQDVLISGVIDNSIPKTAMYINDGIGQFSELNNLPFPNIFASSNALADLDNDSDLDVVLIGSAAGGLPNIFSIIFENIGNNAFIAADSLIGVYIPANTINDFNGDAKKDIIIQGFIDNTNIYWNESLISSVIENSNIPFSIFPNPTTNEITVKSDYKLIGTPYTVYDNLGKLVLNGSITKELTYIEMGDLPGGIYMLSVGDYKKPISKIIKQ